MKDNSNLVTIENIIGYSFNDKGILQRAITHSSYNLSQEKLDANYQRMEYLGDALLDFVVADELFRNYPAFDEGELTKVRASVVSKKPLADIIKRLEIDKYFLYAPKNSILSDKIISDIFESIVAGIYLDSNSIAPAREFILDNIRPLIAMELGQDTTDHKSRLYEYCTANKMSLKFELTKTDGPAHDLVFYYDLYINDELIATASGQTKRSAQQLCSEEAYKKLGVNN